jgi:ferredoxin-type protein NapG
MARPDEPSSTDRSVSRRGFFRGLVVRGLDEAEHLGRRVAASLPSFIGDSVTQPSQSSPSQAIGGVRYLRPPGALPEAGFLDACTRCGDCVRACPAQCIIVRETPPDAAAPGPLAFPHIVARTSPCVVCEDLSCMKACPTDALQLTDSVFAIAMGTARVNHTACLRSAGEACSLCVTQCPLGDKAIGVGDDGRIDVRSACIGCGVCERACPTEPTSIVVEPSLA